VTEVFQNWQAEHGKQRSKLDAKRRARIRARLAEGFSVEQLCKAIRGAKRDSFLMGQDPKSPRVFDGLETILRDAAQVERLIALAEGKGPSRASGPGYADHRGPGNTQAPRRREMTLAEARRQRERDEGSAS
jgi:hypothetical protein